MKTLTDMKWPIVAICAVLILFMLLKGCKNTGSKAQEQIEQIRDSLFGAKTEIAFLEVEKNKLSATIEGLASDTAILKSQVREREKMLTAAQRKAINLSGEINAAKNKKDTAAYKDNCDDLVSAVSQLSNEVDKYRTDYQLLTYALDSMLLLKDSSIGVLAQQLSACKKTIDYTDWKIGSVQKAVKPRNQLFIGGQAFGNGQTLLKGYGGDIALLNKSGQLFQAGVVLIAGQQFYKIGFLSRLSLTKK